MSGKIGTEKKGVVLYGAEKNVGSCCANDIIGPAPSFVEGAGLGSENSRLGLKETKGYAYDNDCTASFQISGYIRTKSIVFDTFSNLRIETSWHQKFVRIWAVRCAFRK